MTQMLNRFTLEKIGGYLVDKYGNGGEDRFQEEFKNNDIIGLHFDSRNGLIYFSQNGKKFPPSFKVKEKDLIPVVIGPGSFEVSKKKY